MNTKGKLASMLLASLLLAACGGGMSGTYTESHGIISLTFHSDKVDVTSFTGVTKELGYKTDGDKVVLKSPEGNLVLTRNKDGSLATPWGTMSKKN